MREWLIKLTLIAFGFFIIIVSMVALEFGLSKFAPAPETYPVGFNERDEYIGWKGKPSLKEKKYVYGRKDFYVGRNSYGFRDKERTYEKEKGTFRIVILGDSFTEGLSVPLKETFPANLEKILNSESNKRFEVINLGITSFSTAQEYLTLKYYGLKYHPDLVILDFFIGNDVRENSLLLTASVEGEGVSRSRPFFVVNNDKLEQIPFEITVSNPSKYEEQNEKRGVTGHFQILKDSLLKFFPNIYYSLNDRIIETPWLWNFFWKIGIKDNKPGLLDESKLTKNRIDNRVLMDFNVYTEKYPPEWENAWEVTKSLILKLANELEADKIGFLVVVIPNEFEFRLDIWDKNLNDYPQMRAIKYDLRKPERILSNFLESNNIDYLLLRPGFEEYSKETGKDLHFHGADGHWNADGHALAAELIYKKLKDDRLVSIKRGE